MKPVPYPGAGLWLCGLLLVALAASATAAERLRVRFAPEQNYGPFIYASESGQVQGLSYELLLALLPDAELELELQPPAPLDTILQRAEAGQVDLISSLRPTPERARFLGFTRPYVSIPAVLLMPEQTSSTLDKLARQPVAVGRGYAVEAFVRERYPAVQWQAVSDDRAGMRLLQEGKVRGVVIDLASAIFTGDTIAYRDWRVAQQIGFDYQLSFAYPLSRPDIGERLDRALRQFDDTRRQAILARWLSRSGAPAQNMQRQILTGAGLGLLAGAIVLLLRQHFRRRGRS
ncbi:transporter substrate-binding domain-containing protein [Chitinilyticum piscinae]|uniref:Transporter substrate-binding domain-containing protein n=1 Tax=Chitinilyticum piscinae TaxID=2866724 RepID=A0A8J7FPX0_9NEIS|nr:transporter substrate-binding domain-containing protein [Chitinilyticum piscinae]MBE9608451.1 transporter substrate-binding domain-containing protein [Chitinilyticum piscinae]